MKLASPFQRGTTCWCRCPEREPPAAAPRLMPTLKACGDATPRIVATAVRVRSVSSRSSAGSSSVRSATCRYGQTMRCPGLYGNRLRITKQCSPRWTISDSSSARCGPLQKGHPGSSRTDGSSPRT